MRIADAVLFDVNETLLDLAPVREAFAAAGLSPGRMDAWFRGVLVDGIAAAAAGTFAAFTDIAHHLLGEELATAGLPRDRAGAILASFGALEVHADVAPALERLRRAGIPAIALTNGTSGAIRGALERAGLAELMADRWDVGEVARWKPAADPYLWAADRLGLAPPRLALVAVHPWDVHGAGAAGLQGVFVDRSGTGRYPPYLLAPAVSATDLDAAVAQLV